MINGLTTVEYAEPYRNQINNKIYNPFLWRGFTFLKPVELLRGTRLLLTMKSP